MPLPVSRSGMMVVLMLTTLLMLSHVLVIGLSLPLNESESESAKVLVPEKDSIGNKSMDLPEENATSSEYETSHQNGSNVVLVAGVDDPKTEVIVIVDPKTSSVLHEQTHLSLEQEHSSETTTTAANKPHHGLDDGHHQVPTGGPGGQAFLETLKSWLAQEGGHDDNDHDRMMAKSSKEAINGVDGQITDIQMDDSLVVAAASNDMDMEPVQHVMQQRPDDQNSESEIWNSSPATQRSDRQRFPAGSEVQQGGQPDPQGSEWAAGSCPPDSECQNNGLQVSVSSSEGLTIPAGINLTLRCVVTMPLNHTTVRVDWNSPQAEITYPEWRQGADVFGDGSGPVSRGKDVPESERPSGRSKIHVWNELFEQSSKGTLTVISTMRVVNVTTDQDSGTYVCSAGSHPTCCRQTDTITVRVYSPPTHATDFAIICVVCFIEFVIILYCKTKNSGTRYTVNAASGGVGGGGRCSSSDYEPLPRTTKEAELQSIEQEHHQVKT